MTGVRTWQEEVRLKISSAVKTLASGSSSLDPFPAEPQCWGPNRSVCKVDAEVTKHMQAARIAAHSYLESMIDVNAKLVMEVLRKKEKGVACSAEDVGH